MRREQEGSPRTTHSMLPAGCFSDDVQDHKHVQQGFLPLPCAFFISLLESNHADLMYASPRLTIMQDFTLTFDRPFGVHTSRSYSETVMIL